MSNTKTFFDDISCTRALLVICIVLGHSFAMYTGGNAWPLPDGVAFEEFYKYINPAVISFHLQSFVFIAGFLFGAQMNRCVSGNIPFVLKKTKRILLPMFIFGILYICLFSPEMYSNGQWIHELCYGPGHLWFLPMLYLCYVSTKLCWPLLRVPSIIGFLLLSILSLLSWVIPATINIGGFFFYWIFFVEGAWLFGLKDYILEKYNKNNIIAILSVTTLVLICIKCWAYYADFSGRTPFLTCVRYILGGVGSITLLFMFNTLERKGVCLSRYRWNGWYGVYIYHQFILMIMYYDLQMVMVDSWLMPILYFFIALITSVILAQLSLMTKVGRFLIG